MVGEGYRVLEVREDGQGVRLLIDSESLASIGMIRSVSPTVFVFFAPLNMVFMSAIIDPFCG